MPQSQTYSNWQKIKDLFHTAAELEPEARSAFLDDACGDDAGLRAELQHLLRADEEAPSLLERSPLAPVWEHFAAEELIEGRRVGPYKLQRQLGRGGMGTVYEAVRADDEFEQRVALKLIRRGMDTNDVRRRFRSERQILANLYHPNIARLLDGGTTEDGLPYFVMEYVAGEELLSYCAARALPISERLALFRKVCAAVAYAHGRLVVHRDLKPSNILVTDDGEPKLLDFGISKLLTPESSQFTGTATGLGMMTPAYASPEQLRGELITTSTDVYSLGVILFELVTGRPPYELKSLHPSEMARVVCETNPARPSDAITRQSSDTSRKTASNCQRATVRSLRGDVDNIILKALRKEPERRYSSVEHLSEDLRRHLTGLPVSARPDTFSYRAGKFIRRNRTSVLAAALVLLTLIGGIIGTAGEAVRAERQRKLSEKRFNEVRELANHVIFKYHDEIAQLPGATKVRELLVTDALKYLDSLAQDAGADVALQRELAQAYMRVGDVQGAPYQANVGDTAGALDSYRKAAALLDDVLRKSPDLETQRQLRHAEQQLSTLALRAGDKNVLEIVRRAISTSERIVATDPTNAQDRLALAQSYIFLGDNSPLGTEAGESIAVFNRALAIVTPIAQESPDNVAALRSFCALNQRLGFHYSQLAENAAAIANSEEARDLYSRAAPFYRRALLTSERLMELEPQNDAFRRINAMSKYDETTVQRELGETDKALQTLQQVLHERAAALIADAANVQAQADLAGVHWDTALIYSRRKQYSLAIQHARQSLSLLDGAIKRDSLNNEYWQGRYHVQIGYGDILAAQQSYDAAIETYRRAFEQLRKAPVAQDSENFAVFESVLHEKVGDAQSAQAAQANRPLRERRARLEASRLEYKRTIELLQTDALPQTSIERRNADRRAYLAQKMTQCEAHLASL
jgi:serine/threonine protein kinase/tetratricopeptide (TPR) repeat protein